MSNKIMPVVMMAFATGNESTEAVSFPKYIGVGSVKVLAVNPTKEKLEEIYKTKLDKDPEYVSIAEIGEDKLKVPQVKLDFILTTAPEKNNGIAFTTKATFFLKKAYRFNKDKTKMQFINQYGETGWLTKAEADLKIVSDNMKWFDASNIRPLYMGEEELTGFLKAYLCIPNKSYKKKSGEIVILDDLTKAEARLDTIDKLFTGNVKDLQDIINMRPDNLVKAVFGPKTTDDNRVYQDVFTPMFVKNNVTDYSYVEKIIKEKQDSGSYKNSTFTVEPLHEYQLKATTFTKEATSSQENPFDTDPAASWGFTAGETN